MTNYNFPNVNFIGNKIRIADWIINNFPIKSGTVVDLFSGGASVSYKLKCRGFRVLSNDLLYSNFILAKALVENSEIKINRNILETSYSKIEYKKALALTEFLTDKIYHRFEVEELAKFVALSSKIEDYEKSMLISLIRRAMIRKVPYSRLNIKWEEILKLRDEDYSYKVYKRKRAYHNQSFEYHIISSMESYNNAIFSNGRENKAFQSDALDFLNNLNEKIDLIYMDPPYPSTMNNYNDFYGAIDRIFTSEIDFKLDLTKKNSFIQNFHKLILLALSKAKYIAISINNKSNPGINEMVALLENYAKVKVHLKSHNYRISGSTNKNSNIEALIIGEFI